MTDLLKMAEERVGRVRWVVGADRSITSAEYRALWRVAKAALAVAATAADDEAHDALDEALDALREAVS